MNWVIFPKYAEETSKKSWIIRTLEIYGVLTVIGAALSGFFVAGPVIAAWLMKTVSTDYNTASLGGRILGLIGGIFSGLWVSLPAFALAMVIDDIHATRLQTGAYVAFQSDSVKLGR